MVRLRLPSQVLEAHPSAFRNKCKNVLDEMRRREKRGREAYRLGGQEAERRLARHPISPRECNAPPQHVTWIGREHHERIGSIGAPARRARSAISGAPLPQLLPQLLITPEHDGPVELGSR